MVTDNTDINIDNWLVYAAKHYDSSCYDDEEFFEDVQRIKYLKRLFRRYKDKGELKERLILNHIIVLNNVFPPPHALKILFLHLDEYKEYLKPFLLYLNLMPEKIVVGNKVYYRHAIIDDKRILERLKEI